MNPRIEILGSFNQLAPNEELIICHDPEARGPFDHDSIVRIHQLDQSLLLQLESKDKFVVLPTDFTYAPETDVLFFRSDDQWGTIDLKTKRLVGHHSAPWIPIIWRYGDVMIIEDDLTAWSCDLKGNLIDKVPIDPPTDAIKFADRIEYSSPVYGNRTLRLRR